MTPVHTVGTLQDFVEAGLDAVRATLDDHVTVALSELPSGGADYRNLWQTIGSQFEGGKNLRPSLTLAAYGGLGGESPEAAVPVAAAMEMLHTAMLIHDDVLDNDEVRRGRPNVAGTRRAELRYNRLSDAQVEAHVMTAALLALDLVTRAIRTTIAGELLDMYADMVPPEDANSLLVAELKTATYSVVVPLLAGAQLAGADPTMIGHLDKIGASLGLSFQLMDDDLGVFGDPEVTGKSVLSDLRAGKRTELLRLGFHLADDDEREVLRSSVGRPDLDEDGARRVREVLESCGARASALKVARQHARSAKRIALERVSAPLSGYLVALIDTLDTRSA
jgi:geranylgeranyl diphosphate synthase type II